MKDLISSIFANNTFYPLKNSRTTDILTNGLLGFFNSFFAKSPYQKSINIYLVKSAILALILIHLSLIDASCQIWEPGNIDCGGDCSGSITCKDTLVCTSECENNSEVQIFQCAYSIPGSSCFGCQKYVNAALALGKAWDETPYYVTAETGSDHPSYYTCADCECANVGLVRIPINEGTLRRAHVAHYPSQHYAYRAKEGSQHYYYSKHGSEFDRHIYKHWNNTTCLSFGLIDSLWAFVGNVITATPSTAFDPSINDSTIFIQNGQTIILSLEDHEDVSFQWTETSPYLSIIGCTTCNEVSINASLCLPNAAYIGRVRVRYKATDENCLDCYQRKQTYNVVAVSNSCCIIGTYSYSIGNNLYTYNLNAWNSTPVYATSVSITDCANSTLTWTKTSGSGSIHVTNNGKNATIYLNSNQSASYLIQGGGTSRTVSFTRTNFSPNDPGDGKELSFSSGIFESELEQNFQLKSPSISGQEMPEIEFSSRLIVAPNPTFDKLKIYQPMEDVVQNLNIYDLAGLLILSKTVDAAQIEVDVSSLHEGIYVLKIGSMAAKFVKTSN